jgi:hypothetical protein
VSELSIKKQYERFLLEQFLEVAGLSGEIVDDTGEAPDFIVQIERELVGVEITELFIIEGDRAENLQAQEALAQRIVSHAQRLYVSSGARHAHVSVHFAPGVDLRTLNRNQTAAALAAFVSSQSLTVGQHVQWHQDYVGTSLPDAVTYVQMLGVPEPGMAHWTVPRAGWVAPMNEGVLQTSIDEKTALLPKYRERVGTNWLLLVADGSKPSQFFEPPSDAVASAITSPFARTFYFGRMRRTVLELGVPSK